VAYKYSSGSVRRGDVYFEGDRTGASTYIDFGQDTITLRPGDSQILHATDTAIGIGTTNPTEVLTLNATDPTIRFEEGGTFKASIGVNSSDNILIENKTMNKHIVFKANDQGTVREGLRLDGAVPEVVVNQQHGVGGDDSLIDFRVESENNTHMLFVSGGSDRVGIATSSPNSGLHVNTSVTFAGKVIASNYTILSTDHMIFANAGGGNIAVTLPTAVGIVGRQYIVKRVDPSVNSVTIETNGSETIEGASNKSLTDQCSVVVVSDNSNWWITSEYISPPP